MERRRFIMPSRVPTTQLAWRKMIERCERKTAHNYYLYGGRGITVCDKWHTFEAFLDDMGTCPIGKSLDRHPDNDGNYEPGNCRWATPAEQNINRRNTMMVPYESKQIPLSTYSRIMGYAPRGFAQFVWQRVHRLGYSPEKAINDLTDNRTTNITFNGKTQSMTAWAYEVGIPVHSLSNRLRKLGWSLEDALTPVDARSSGMSHRAVHVVIHKGEAKSLVQACKDAGIGYNTVIMRSRRQNLTLQQSFDLFVNR